MTSPPLNPPPPGDPEGRRLARRQAQLLSEAGIVAHVLEVLLRRTDCEATACADLLKEIHKQEAAALQKSYGRIEPRTRFKTGIKRDILWRGPRYVLHVDEGGKSNPEKLTPPQPTYFALAGISIAEEAMLAYSKRADAVKQKFFGHTDVTFHEPHMRERRDWFDLRGDVAKQREFDEAINELLESTEFKVFGVGIRKDAYQKEFIDAGLDPYLPNDVYALAIIMLMERYLDFLSSQADVRLGRVIFESQGTLEDAIHQLEYARALVNGSQWVAAKSFQLWLEPGLTFRPKMGSDPMEIADMFARDLYEWTRSECTGNPKRWELFSKRIYCRDDGRMGKFGVKIFPDSDIRDRVDKHRISCGATP